MLTRSDYMLGWLYTSPVDPAANILLHPGANLSNFGFPGRLYSMPLETRRRLSIGVTTNQAVSIDVEVGLDPTAVAFTLWLTLICQPVLYHNTCYNLPAPYNRDGFLIVTAPYMRLRVRNTTANLATPFELLAHVW